MARLVVPITLSFMGAGMPWVLQGELSTDWTAATVTSPYVQFGYVTADYFIDEEWTIAAEPDETWTLVPAP